MMESNYDIEAIKKELKENGYVIIKDILSKDELEKGLELFQKWRKSIPELDKIHNKVDPHGIYKHHQVGHQEYAWYIRTRPNIINFYKKLWDTDELSVSFDGSCYIPKDCDKLDNIWTHTDQAPNSKGLKCYQGFVALTTNKERTLRVYKKSHLLHEKYFKEKNIVSSKNWQLIDKEYLETIKENKCALEIDKGSLVLWDSRVFHQNQYGKPKSEERIVQYICYLPKNNKLNSESQKKKKLKYYKELRTTSHWPYPIKVNSLQPRTWGDDSLKIDYEKLPKPNLKDMENEILKLII